MPRLAPISWRNFIKKIKSFGFVGPFQEGKHPYMTKGPLSITVPNPHDGDVSVDLQMKIIKQAGIKRASWMNKK